MEERKNTTESCRSRAQTRSSARLQATGRYDSFDSMYIDGIPFTPSRQRFIPYKQIWNPDTLHHAVYNIRHKVKMGPRN